MFRNGLCLWSPPTLSWMYPHVPPVILKGAEILCALHSHTHYCGYCLFFLSFYFFLHVIYIAQSRILDFPPHTQTHMHARQLWLANDLQLTNGIRNVNGSMAGMQMYVKQIRHGRKQTSIFFSPSQPSQRRELTWCSWRTPSQIDARALALRAG